MRKEYNVKKLKLKRRGLLPTLQADEAYKIRITIALDSGNRQL